MEITWSLPWQHLHVVTLHFFDSPKEHQFIAEHQDSHAALLAVGSLLNAAVTLFIGAHHAAMLAPLRTYMDVLCLCVLLSIVLLRAAAFLSWATLPWAKYRTIALRYPLGAWLAELAIGIGFACCLARYNSDKHFWLLRTFASADNRFAANHVLPCRAIGAFLFTCIVWPALAMPMVHALPFKLHLPMALAQVASHLTTLFLASSSINAAHPAGGSQFAGSLPLTCTLSNATDAVLGQAAVTGGFLGGAAGACTCHMSAYLAEVATTVGVVVGGLTVPIPIPVFPRADRSAVVVLGFLVVLVSAMTCCLLYTLELQQRLNFMRAQQHLTQGSPKDHQQLLRWVMWVQLLAVWGTGFTTWNLLCRVGT